MSDIRELVSAFRALGEECGTDKTTVHAYHEVYPRYLRDLKDKPFVLFEIGVAHGGSMRLWSKWFPHAEVHGFDHNKKGNVPEGLPGHVHIVDVMEPEFANLVQGLPRPHVVVDDGGHWDKHIQAAHSELWPRLLPGGWYFIEDLHDRSRKHPSLAKKNGYVQRVGEMAKELVAGISTTISDMHLHREICVIRKA